jgi:hypothetical protein
MAQVRNGACFNSGYNDGSLPRPFCFSSQDRPVVGCRDPGFDKASCKSFEVTEQNYWYWRTWMMPAMTEADCVSQAPGRYGCYLPMYPDRHLNWFNESACDCYDGVMMNGWEWRGGEWRGGQVRKTEKMVASVTTRYAWNTTALSFMLLRDWIANSVEIKILYGLKSESLCSWNVVESNLNSVTCDCIASDSPKGWLV